MLSLIIGSSPSAGGAPEPGAERPGQRLLGKLKVIADTGRLHDRVFVTRTLEMELSGSSRETVDQPAKCENDFIARSRIVSSFIPAGESWLRPSGDGVASLQAYTPFGPEPVTISGATVLDYSITKTRYCSGFQNRIEETDAGLKISRVHTFACISPDQLEAWLPGVELDIDHHAERIAHYRGREYPDRAAIISFRFSYSRCVESIDVSQHPDRGLRYRAAEERHNQCLLPHKAEYCRAHPPFGWEHGGTQIQMDRFAVAKCGTFDKFYRSTPRNARPTERPLPRGDESTPCTSVLSDLSASSRGPGPKK
jgi:hypothetical protein